MSVLDKLFGRGNVTYHIAVAEALDSVAAAIFAEQIAFWQARSNDGWAFRTSDEIREYTGLTRRVQDTARKHLKDVGVLEERREGMPQRLYFRLDMEALARLIEDSSPDLPQSEEHVQNRQSDAPNGQSVCTKPPVYIEGEEREEKRVPERSSENARNSTPNQILMDRFYENLRDEYGVRLTKERYGFHLGKFRDILNTDKATPEEQERVLSHMTKNYPNAPKINAVDALADVRLGRDTGEAWNKPAPWEVAKDESRKSVTKDYGWLFEDRVRDPA